MIFSGENFVLTPKTSELSFTFSDLSLLHDGVAGIGFSGNGHESLFTFSGKRITDPNGNFAFSYETGAPTTISGDIRLGSEYRYFINDYPVGDGITSPQNFAVEKLLVRTTGCDISASISLSCPKINYEVLFSPTFVAGGEITGVIKNNSNIDFKVLGSYFSETNTEQNLTGIITGDVLANSDINFSLTDVSSSYSNDSLNSILNIQTTFGLITKKVESQRMSGLLRNVSNITTLRTPAFEIVPYFSGSGNAEGFIWQPYTEQKEEYTVFYEKRNEDGELVDKNLRVKLENVSPETGIEYTGTYVTSFFTYFSGHEYCLTGQDCSNTQYTTKTSCETAGTCSEGGHTTQAACEAAGKTWTSETWTDHIRPIWQCSGDMPGSGRYSELPEITFGTYSKVTGVNFNTNNLFTKDTPTKLPMLFSGEAGELGAGASGYFLTEDFEINLKNYLPEGHKDNTPDETDESNWKRITGYELTNFGTGYTKMPAVFAATGLYNSSAPVSILEDDSYWDNTAVGGTGYDIGKRREPYVYREIKAEAVGELEAAYLTGIPYFGKSGDVHLFSGILITNPGSGFDAVSYIPFINFVRNANDTFGSQSTSSTWNSGDNTSGEFLFNDSGTFYELTNNWDMETGSYSVTQTGARFKENNLTLNGQYSGSVDLDATDQNFFVRVYFNNSDIDESIISKLIIEGDGYASSEYLITGSNRYSMETGFGLMKPEYYTDGENLFNKTYFGS
jgi:hypothetical protein